MAFNYTLLSDFVPLPPFRYSCIGTVTWDPLIDKIAMTCRIYFIIHRRPRHISQRSAPARFSYVQRPQDQFPLPAAIGISLAAAVKSITRSLRDNVVDDFSFEAFRRWWDKMGSLFLSRFNRFPARFLFEPRVVPLSDTTPISLPFPFLLSCATCTSSSSSNISMTQGSLDRSIIRRICNICRCLDSAALAVSSRSSRPLFPALGRPPSLTPPPAENSSSNRLLSDATVPPKRWPPSPSLVAEETLPVVLFSTSGTPLRLRSHPPRCEGCSEISVWVWIVACSSRISSMSL